jgi:hypothetical protein
VERAEDPRPEDRRLPVGVAFLLLRDLLLREGARRFPRVRVAGIPAR